MTERVYATAISIGGKSGDQNSRYLAASCTYGGCCNRRSACIAAINSNAEAIPKTTGGVYLTNAQWAKVQSGIRRLRAEVKSNGQQWNACWTAASDQPDASSHMFNALRFSEANDPTNVISEVNSATDSQTLAIAANRYRP